MKKTLDSWLLVLANLLLPAAVLVFAIGFFPYKPILPGFAQFDNGDARIRLEAPFDKVIFMVVDALRSDFIYSEKSNFKFTQRLISSGRAIPFTAHAAPPTITMPRVKAITTGSVPSFLDVILNFIESDTTSSLAGQDTWLAQIRANGGNLVFYGDDTWLKLFPDTFSRFDGTSSFFVSDFTEVDNNVTRHVSGELRADDWDAMILHYLGLDHIGHKTGPNGPNMPSKQAEMDAIIEEIHNAMVKEPHLNSTLLILLGDHGMNEGGNHGGTAPGETSPALVFISPHFEHLSQKYESPIFKTEQDLQYYKTVDQSDIVPTISGLLGLPIPQNNLGVFLTEFLPLWSSGAGIRNLERNAEQLRNILKATFPSSPFDSTPEDSGCKDLTTAHMQLQCKWFQATCSENINTKADVNSKIEKLIDFCKSTQVLMSNTASDYNTSLMTFGIIISACSVLSSFPSFLRLLQKEPTTGVLLLVITSLYSVMMFASSYVEEEQQFWYWISSTWIAYLQLRCFRNTTEFNNNLAILVLFCALRISRRWNQTGQKYAGEIDIAHDYLARHRVLLWLTVGSTYVSLLRRTRRYLSFNLYVVMIVVCYMAIIFKINFTAHDAPELLPTALERLFKSPVMVSMVFQARFIFVGLLTIFGIVMFSNKKFITMKSGTGLYYAIILLFLITQSRTLNIGLFELFDVQLGILGTHKSKHLHLIVSVLLFSYSSFFALGNSNAISSIDLSNAYNGVSGFNVLAVAVLLFTSNWAGPIYWTLGGVLLLNQMTFYTKKQSPRLLNSADEITRVKTKDSERINNFVPSTVVASKDDIKETSLYTQYTTVFTFFTSSALLSVMMACLVLREHLFIWSVFSPKYLYMMVWAVIHQLGVCVGMCGFIWGIS